MSNPAAKLFMDYLKEKELHSSYADEAEKVVLTSWVMENTSFDIFSYFEDDCNDVHIVGIGFLKVSESDYEKVLPIINQCNHEYRWVKFILDTEHGFVTTEDDAIIELETCAEEIYELVMRMTSIVEDAYPKLMKAIWG